jgi:hypothetical protein
VICVFAEDPYFIDEELLVEREALLTAEDKEVMKFVINLCFCINGTKSSANIYISTRVEI